MTKKIDDSSSPSCSELSVPPLAFSSDCSPFLEWDEEELESAEELAIVFRSLVATLKLQPALDVSLEAKADAFMKTVDPLNHTFADAFLESLASFSGDSQRYFIQCIVVLLSSACHIITRTAMKMIESLSRCCSAQVNLALVQAGFIPQILVTLNPQSLSFAEAEDFHTDLISNISRSLWLATPDGLADLTFKDDDEQQDVHESILKQVLAPSEKYIWHLCVNRYSIINGEQSKFFLGLLVRLIRISPYYQPTMELVLHLPVFLSIPSCLTFFEDEESIWLFLLFMVKDQQEWNEKRGDLRQMWKTVHRVLRMEGIEDVMEEKLQNEKDEFGGWIVEDLMELNNLLGMNLPEPE
ncbi:hypothetical protein BLNAU_11730 [Blattamonas nauphoetae]|uniref:Uncharacterized protein n=1 Tax=Blattamonas nauphoetae TaxID=2049346 RepID=A0ABQ9XPG0_9EUKA|nr:hypothetical protein BLNAU_11730 [Blattamonas nauphoetae]